MSVKIKNNVYWVGKTDWELRKFHGDEYSTHRGTSYNSYLIREDKTVLVDTVWAPFSKEFVRELAKEIDLRKIDYIVINHGEIDHSGALPELMSHIPDTPIYCTANGVKSIKGHYHQDWNFNTVKTGDKLSLGNKDLIFIEAPMLHWPDTMFCYLTEDEILFSNDAFGQHYASEHLYNDKVDKTELYQEAVKYYANILTPFSSFVTKKINEVIALDVPVSIIATSHGIIWRDDPLQIVKQYLEWADSYQENQVTVLYDTMWNGTRIMAEEIAKGIVAADKNITVKLFNTAITDKNDVITEVFKSKAILVGSPTINKGILTSMAAVMEEIKGLAFKNKKGGAFGAYGWSGESVKILTDLLEASGITPVNDGIKVMWNPDEESRKKAFDYGKNFTEEIDS